MISLKSLLYGLKQSSANWYDCMKKVLEHRGFRESKAGPCVFMKKGMIILTYVNDCILIVNKKEILDQFIRSLSNGIEKFEFIEPLKGKEFIF